MEQGIRKMTSLAANVRAGDRGLLQEGYFADITVFDPETIKDTATTTTGAIAQGVKYVSSTDSGI